MFCELIVQFADSSTVVICVLYITVQIHRTESVNVFEILWKSRVDLDLALNLVGVRMARSHIQSRGGDLVLDKTCHTNAGLE